MQPISKFFHLLSVGNVHDAATALKNIPSPSLETAVPLRELGIALHAVNPAQGTAFLGQLERGSPPDSAFLQKTLERGSWAQWIRIADVLKDGRFPGVSRLLSEGRTEGLVEEKEIQRARAFRRAAAEIERAIQNNGMIVVLSGAGISAESGVATYRGSDPLVWKGRLFEEIASVNALEREPEEVWEFYQWRRKCLDGIFPNAAHVALAELGARIGERLFLITQNVDGLHERAGSEKVVNFHGTLWAVKCQGPDCRYQRSLKGYSETLSSQCPDCGGKLRPGVVLFGDPIPREIMTRSKEAARDADIFLLIGTSGVVYPAASLAKEARKYGATIVIINPEPPEILEKGDLYIPGKAAETIPHLLPTNIAPFSLPDNITDGVTVLLKKARRSIHHKDFKKGLSWLRAVLRMVLLRNPEDTDTVDGIKLELVAVLSDARKTTLEAERYTESRPLFEEELELLSSVGLQNLSNEEKLIKTTITRTAAIVEEIKRVERSEYIGRDRLDYLSHLAYEATGEVFTLEIILKGTLTDGEIKKQIQELFEIANYWRSKVISWFLEGQRFMEILPNDE